MLKASWDITLRAEIQRRHLKQVFFVRPFGVVQEESRLGSKRESTCCSILRNTEEKKLLNNLQFWSGSCDHVWEG